MSGDGWLTRHDLTLLRNDHAVREQLKTTVGSPQPHKVVSPLQMASGAEGAMEEGGGGGGGGEQVAW